MIRLPPYALPAFAAVLALVFTAEWFLPGPGITPRHNIFAPPLQPGNAVDDSASQWGDTALARPLFHADRRPVAATGSAADSSLPRLSAIIIIGGTRGAIFAADGQKPQIIWLNGSINGYRLARVGPESVDLLGPGGITTITPRYITTPQAAPPSAANINEENN